jgi:hypothetical protein
MFCDARPLRRTWINVHLGARDAGVGRSGSAWEAFWKDGAAIERRGVKPNCAKAVGRMRRRRNVSGIVWGGCSCGDGGVVVRKVEDAEVDD